MAVSPSLTVSFHSLTFTEMYDTFLAASIRMAMILIIKFNNAQFSLGFFVYEPRWEKEFYQQHNATPPPGRQLSSVSSALEQQCVKGKRWDLVAAPLLSPQPFICFSFLQFCSSSEDVLNRRWVSLVLIQHGITPGSSSVKPQTSTVDSWAAPTFHLWVEFLARGYLWQMLLRRRVNCRVCFCVLFTHLWDLKWLSATDKPFCLRLVFMLQ